jgi:hypothetical protein
LTNMEVGNSELGQFFARNPPLTLRLRREPCAGEV